VHEPDERVAFVYFRSAEDAREVKHSKALIFIYDKSVKIEAAYESEGASGGGNSGRGTERYEGRTGDNRMDRGVNRDNRRYVFFYYYE
jgi:hypothetical protein